MPHGRRNLSFLVRQICASVFGLVFSACGGSICCNAAGRSRVESSGCWGFSMDSSVLGLNCVSVVYVFAPLCVFESLPLPFLFLKSFSVGSLHIFILDFCKIYMSKKKVCVSAVASACFRAMQA